MTVIAFPKLHSIEAVLEQFDKAFKPSKAEFNSLLEDLGCYRELGGKRFMLDEDIAYLFEAIRAVPAARELQSGPARLILATPPPNEMGYAVFIGDPLVMDGPVFIGWAPRDDTGMSDLLSLVQLGNENDLAVLGSCVSTPREVEEHRARLKQWRAREANEGWFHRTGAVREILLKLRGEWRVDGEGAEMVPVEKKVG